MQEKEGELRECEEQVEQASKQLVALKDECCDLKHHTACVHEALLVCHREEAERRKALEVYIRMLTYADLC
jgi:septal ring factor EnvC (AmiA/AmiB activator)